MIKKRESKRDAHVSQRERKSTRNKDTKHWLLTINLSDTQDYDELCKRKNKNLCKNWLPVAKQGTRQLLVTLSSGNNVVKCKCMQKRQYKKASL